jgi:hypothetical protein
MILRVLVGLQLAPYRLVHALCEVANVMLVKTCHGDPSVCCHVNVSLLRQGLGLVRVQTGEAGEHVRSFVSFPHEKIKRT